MRSCGPVHAAASAGAARACGSSAHVEQVAHELAVALARGVHQHACLLARPVDLVVDHHDRLVLRRVERTRTR
eukprot:2573278-Prymnesium_polylepis.1